MTTTTLRRFIATLIPAAIVTAAIVTATVVTAAPASATNQPSCRNTGTASVCQKQGHASLSAKPTVRQPMGSLFSNAWLPGYGRGHLPPLIALD